MSRQIAQCILCALKFWGVGQQEYIPLGFRCFDVDFHTNIIDIIDRSTYTVKRMARSF